MNRQERREQRQSKREIAKNIPVELQRLHMWNTMKTVIATFAAFTTKLVTFGKVQPRWHWNVMARGVHLEIQMMQRLRGGR